MSRIYRTADRIALKIDDLTVKISPLSLHQKTQIQQAMIDGKSENSLEKATQGIALALKFGLKDIVGLENADGSPYALQFDDSGLTEECINDLMNIQQRDKLILVCSSMANAIPSSFNIEGVEFISTAKEPAAKNA
jgi:hypothetical protein